VIKQMTHEGPTMLYRGLLPPLIQKGLCRSTMFGMNNRYQQLLDCRTDVQFSGRHALAAFLGWLHG